MTFEIMFKDKPLTKKQVDDNQDIILAFLNREISKEGFNAQMARRIDQQKVEVTISVGTKKGFGNYTLFVTQNGLTTEIKITKRQFDELVINGSPFEG